MNVWSGICMSYIIIHVWTRDIRDMLLQMHFICSHVVVLCWLYKYRYLHRRRTSELIVWPFCHRSSRVYKPHVPGVHNLGLCVLHITQAPEVDSWEMVRAGCAEFTVHFACTDVETSLESELKAGLVCMCIIPRPYVCHSFIVVNIADFIQICVISVVSLSDAQVYGMMRETAVYSVFVSVDVNFERVMVSARSEPVGTPVQETLLFLDHSSVPLNPPVKGYLSR